MRRAQRLGRLAAVTQLVFAGVLGGFASLHAEVSLVQRGPVLLAIFGLPGIVGWVGAIRRRPALVAAAALTSGVGSFIAFSGATLIFLMPAAMFLASALLLVLPARDEPFGSVVSRAGQLVLAAAICVLVVGAGASALLITDSACWLAHETAFGTAIEALPYSDGGMTLGGDVTSGGCSTGLLSLRGVGLGALLATAALGLVAVAARRRPLEPPDPRMSVAAG
jgi:hypothetical protein